MTRIDVDLGDRSYPIQIDAGILGDAGHRIAEIRPAARVAIVTDANIEALHGPALRKSLVLRGLQRGKAFSWERTAAGVLRSCRMAAEGK